MQLPISISPNPLFISTIEIRFSTNINRLELLQKMSSVFSKDLPILEDSKIPQELKDSEEQFRFAADYTLKNSDYSLSFGTRSLSIEHISEYKYWATYFVFIKDCLEKVFQLNFIEKIERCGVRYGSILDGNNNPKDILIDVPKIEINNMQSNFAGFQSVFKTNISTLFLQISSNAKLNKAGLIRTGFYIDIDASYSKELKPNSDVFTIIDTLHKDQKELFFGLLTDDFIKTLNPKYGTNN
jgi:uncharacterized protein (TIGR04255 family)